MNSILIKFKNSVERQEIISFLTDEEKAKSLIPLKRYNHSSWDYIYYDLRTQTFFPYRLYDKDPYVKLAITLKVAKKVLATLKKEFVKEKPSFYLGFEIEGCIFPLAKTELAIFLTNLYKEVPIAELIHYDGSIRPKCRGIEIVTPPLPAFDAVEKLKILLSYLDGLTKKGEFETNRTCGLHVNVSEQNCFSTKTETHRSKFAFEFMRNFDVNKWLKSFRRTNNRYCKWNYGPPKYIKDVYDFNYIHHHTAINTMKLHLDEPKFRRLEIRCAGGKNFHTKTDKLNNFLFDIEQGMKEAYNSI